MSNVLNLVAPSFIGISYLSQALEMKGLLETFGAKFDLPDNFEENEDTFLELLPQLIHQFPLYFTRCGSDVEVESAFFSLISMIQLLSQVGGGQGRGSGRQLIICNELLHATVTRDN